MKNIIAFSASNHSNSINRGLLKFAIPYLNGYQVNMLDIRDYPMPMYSIDTEKKDGYPETTKELREIFSHADGFIIATPEHNGSIPAVFKNVIDWLSRISNYGKDMFFNKPVLLLSTAPGAGGGATNLATLTKLMPWWGVKSVRSYSLGNYHENVVDSVLNKNEEKRLAEEVRSFLEQV